MWIGIFINFFLLDWNLGKYYEIFLFGGVIYIYMLY